jgi:hypothetical protein
MKVKEYLKKYNVTGDVTFIIAKAEKDENTPFYHSAYVTTPITHATWLEDKCPRMLDYVVLNDHQPPIDWLSGSNWNMPYSKGWLRCMLVTTEEELKKMYSEEQAKSIERFCETQFKA